MIGFKVVNEWNDFEPVYYCGGCLDTSTGVEPLAEGDVRTCHYCNTELGSDDWLEEDEIGTVHYAEGFTFVNVYEVDRLYGGPEEGGWWFDAGTIVKSVQVREDDAPAVLQRLQAEYPKTGDSSSVIYSGGDYHVYIEALPGKDYPEHTPHYE